MAKPNYSYEKRQKELAKKQKKQEKLLKKSVPSDSQAQEPQSEQTDKQVTDS